jgi:hypothetical protein
LAQPIFTVGPNGQMSARLTLFIGLIFSLLRVSELQETDIPEIVRKAKPAIVEVIASVDVAFMFWGESFRVITARKC